MDTLILNEVISETQLYSLDYLVFKNEVLAFTKLCSQALCSNSNESPTSIKKKATLDEGIYVTTIGHIIRELWANLLGGYY